MRDRLQAPLIFLAGAAVGAAWMLGVVLLDIDLNDTAHDDIWMG